MCAQGRPEETEYGIRFFAGEVADAYLQRAKIQRGYTSSSGVDAMWQSRPSYPLRRPRSPKPGWPFPFPEDEPGHIDEDELRVDVEALGGRPSR